MKFMGWSDFLSALTGNNSSDNGGNADPPNGEGLLPNDYDRVVFGDLPPGDIYRVREEKGEIILIVDISEADSGDWEAAKPALLEEFTKSGGISVGTASPIVSAFRSEEGQQYIRKIISFYEEKVPPRILTMIRESLVLRLAMESDNLQYEEVQRRKRQIAKYGDEGFAIASLCSAGYLDEGRIFWDLYHSLVAEGDYTEDDYENIFLKLVRELPFVVFVKYEDKPQDIYDNVVGKSIAIDSLDYIQFLDVRGMGERNQAKIHRAIEMLEEYHENIEYEKYETDDELVVRVQPTSVS